ncbi:MAG: glycosyltransferase [Desulfobacteraceae bacterium]|nr:MAG: glycosyltransferase [Desulfobacteraceae bacterium]
MDIVILGLSITSSWGNGHATTYRGLVRELSGRGHRIHFLERNLPWYAQNRDSEDLPYCRVSVYEDLQGLKEGFEQEIRDADLVLLGSFVPDGADIGEWMAGAAKGVKAFYDIDTPVTLEKLNRGDCAYLRPDLIPKFDLYLSFTGGPVLEHLERVYGAKSALPLYCSVDPALYYPEQKEFSYDLGYLGTYSNDRQDSLNILLLSPARRWSEGRFVVAGPQYPPEISWPSNVRRIDHIAPPDHRSFYNSLRFTLNVTRSSMVRTGYSPSVRIFEAAACGTPIITDPWDGLDLFLVPGEEILPVRSADEVLNILKTMPRERITEISDRAREKVLSAHTARHRALELEQYVTSFMDAEYRELEAVHR